MTDAAVQLDGSSPIRRRLFPAFNGGALVRALLGLVLITAAVLKGYSLATDPFATTGLPGPRWLAIMLIEAEFLLGSWLLSGFAAFWAHRASLVAFIFLGGAAIYEALAGQPSCGCFGQVKMSPWISLTIDAGAIAGLVLWYPQDVPLSVSSIPRKLRVTVRVWCPDPGEMLQRYQW